MQGDFVMGDVYLLGIRHHGVGSARSVLAALEQLRPDCILIEGPPDADDLIPLVVEAEMQPPVALLAYNPDLPRQAVWYPMAEYSPEWVALRYAVAHEVAVRFMDLPQKYAMALEPIITEGDSAVESDDSSEETTPDIDDEVDDSESIIDDAMEFLRFDPLQALAEAAGEADGEAWWGRVVEETRNPIEVFAAIQDAMTALREAYPQNHPFLARREALREAWMRKTIRAAEKQYARVVVVCGAWHTPALTKRKNAKADDALLKGLKTLKITATFVPWTYSRLTALTGYGAGVISPNWYHHLWMTPPEEVSVRWLSRVAGLLRDEGLLASTAQVIDALRLSETLGDLRGRSVGLDELNEATLAVLCAGRAEPMALVQRYLIIGERMGSVPPNTPTVPLQRDLSAIQKKLRLKVSPDVAVLDLDLRQPSDLARSQLFHRLMILGIGWGKPSEGDVRSKGTFREFWTIQWTPELDIRVIEACVWGNTLEEATLNIIRDKSAKAKKLAELSALLHAVTLADMPTALDIVLARLNDMASLSHDVLELMGGVPSLVNTLRYGDVRRTDSALIAPVLTSLVVRSCIGLYAACMNIDDTAAQALYAAIGTVHSALQVAQEEHLLTTWYDALADLMNHDAPNALLSGMATRLLFRAERTDNAHVNILMRRAFSVGQESEYAARWLEGFLSNLEHILLRDAALLGLVDDWVMSLSAETFEAVLPLTRRTFSTYSTAVRRSLSEKIARGGVAIEQELLDASRGARVVPIMRQILGI
jgi:cell division inhibitor SulA